jgi:hypothetical protein
MQKTLESVSPLNALKPSNRLPQAAGWGLAGGLAGTLVMDLLLMGTLSVLGQPATLCFSIVGDTVSRFLALTGLHVAGGVFTGVVTHYLVGPLFGILFGAILSWLPALGKAGMKKITLAAFVYVELLSQPILATTPILLKMNPAATLQWYAGAFSMHLLLSLVLGLVVAWGLRPVCRVN